MYKKIIILFFTIFVLTSQKSFSIKKECTINLSKNIKLHLYASTFDSTQHSITRCKVINWWAISLINGKQVFGTDWEMPKMQLDSAKAEINGKVIDLDVSCMYNPWFGEIQKDFFSCKECEGGILIQGLFSDGAGTYVAQWKIVSNSSIRTIISNDEKIIRSLFPR